MFRYPTPDDAPGAGFAMVADRFALLLGPEAGDDLASALWGAMTVPDAVFEDLLSIIAAVGIGRLPDFALVELVDVASSSVAVAVRGGATIDLHGPQRSSYSGGGVGTWVEGSAQRVGGISLGLDVATGGGILPLGRGVARANALQWGETDPTREAALDAAPRAAAPLADIDPLETVTIDRGSLADAVGPRRRGNGAPAAAPHAAASGPAPTDAPSPQPETAEIDDSTVLGARRPAAPGVTVPPGVVPEAPRPPRYVLRVGDVEHPLDQPVVLGRSPRAAQHPGARIVAVASPRKEVSGTHLEVSVADDHVLVRDLGSTNGTVLRDPAGVASLLRGGASARVEPGTRLDLGDGVTAELTSTP